MRESHSVLMAHSVRRMIQAPSVRIHPTLLGCLLKAKLRSEHTIGKRSRHNDDSSIFWIRVFHSALIENWLTPTTTCSRVLLYANTLS